MPRLIDFIARSGGPRRSRRKRGHRRRSLKFKGSPLEWSYPRSYPRRPQYEAQRLPPSGKTTTRGRCRSKFKLDAMWRAARFGAPSYVVALRLLCAACKGAYFSTAPFFRAVAQLSRSEKLSHARTSVFSCMNYVAPSYVSMMCSLLVTAGPVMFGRFLMVASGVRQML